ncbi:MAG: ribosomal RNA small subunit methyltransferase A [Cyanobacteria bacterium SIG30]|nr:ribosomal RNA small subunit methyltransferase A [Cyanobacteria bacterium SIG30]
MDKESYIRRVKGFRTKKTLGQNFLIDYSAIEKILEYVDPCDDVVEIGAGVGFVTEELVKKAKSVTAIEIDKDAIKILEKNCKFSILNKENSCDFKIIEQDILKTDLSQFKKDKELKIVANIPYYITSPILAHLLGEIDDINNKNRNSISEIILMVQYEVAKRLVASEKSENIKDYGLLSILAQFWADVEIIKKVSKYSFYPAPKVDSALVRLRINKNPKVEVTPFLRKTIKASFSTRRKNIKNCLQNASFLGVEDALQSCNIDLNTRGEKLSIQDFSNLSKALYEKSKN